MPKSATGGVRAPAKRTCIKQLISALLLAVASTVANPVFAGDPCKMVLCMYGKFTGGGGGGECAGAVAEYFDILVYKKKKKIDWSATAQERLKKQNSCSSADRGITKQINDKFGKARG